MRRPTIRCRRDGPDRLRPDSNVRVAVEIHGYSKEEQDAEDLIPAELAEITLVASPNELRRGMKPNLRIVQPELRSAESLGLMSTYPTKTRALKIRHTSLFIIRVQAVTSNKSLKSAYFVRWDGDSAAP